MMGEKKPRFDGVRGLVWGHKSGPSSRSGYKRKGSGSGFCSLFAIFHGFHDFLKEVTEKERKGKRSL